MTEIVTPPNRGILNRVRNALTVNPSINTRVAQAALAARAGTGPTNPDAATEEAMAAQGMGATVAFSPGRPLSPFNQLGTDPRAYDFATGSNITARPRSGRIDFGTLRAIIDSYDIARMCIEHRIDDIRSLEYRIEALPGHETDADDLIPQALKIIAKPDQYIEPDGTVHEGQPFNTWLSKYLEGVLRYDAGTLYRRRNNLGEVCALEVVDGTTIAPLIDDFGRRPVPPAPAFIQFANGVAWDWFTSRDLIYVPFRPQDNTPYGLAPMEWLLLNANTDLRFQWHFLQYFTDGTIPGGFAEAPPDQSSPDQVSEWQNFWDAVMEGDQARKHQIRWVPSGTKFEFPRDPEFDKDFALFLMRKTCAAYKITPNDLGFTDDVNRATGETQVDIQFRVGTLPLIRHIEGIIDDYLQNDRGLPAAFRVDTGQEKDDRLDEARIWQIAVNIGAASPSEFRTDVLGLAENEDRPVPRYIMTTRGGPVPLASIMGVSGDIDPETAAPTDAALLAPGPFAPDAGVEGQPASGGQPEVPALTAANFGPEQPADSVTAGGDGDDAATTPEEAVKVLTALFRDWVPTESGFIRRVQHLAVKDLTAGVTASTGLTSYDLDRQDDEDEDDEPATPKTASVAGAPIAAGLIVKANDTGRILMIQRALDDTDPAAGCWEFPGGHIDPGETPYAAAVREWCEETGAQLPAGDLAATWVSPNGIYQAFVYVVAGEIDVMINLDHEDRHILNPDDPDGDCIEVAAWWNVADLPNMPALRPECASTDWDAIDAAWLDDGAAHDELVTKELRRWRDNARGRVRKGLTPKRFTSTILDPGTVDHLWQHLQGVVTRDQVDGAFAEAVVKGPKAPAHPGHLYLDRLIDAYRSRLTAALRSGTDPTRLAAEWLNQQPVVKAIDPGVLAAAGAWLAEHQLNSDQLEQALTDLYADAYIAGVHVALDELPAALRSANDHLTGSIDWGRWQPGHPEAARRLIDEHGAGDGLRQLLADADVTIGGIDDTTLDRIARALANGVAYGASPADIARNLTDVLDNTDRAEMIARTETARAFTAAALDTYNANGVAMFDVLVFDPCPICEDQAAANPHPLDDFAPPYHPNCRCAAAPVVELGDGTTVETGDLLEE